MIHSGHLEVVNVVGIEFIDNGRSFRLEIVESIPPHTTSFMTFKNACGLTLFKGGGEEFPLVVIDLSWRECSAEEKHDVLSAHQFPFFDESGAPASSGRALVVAHLEGAITGDILAEEVTFDTPKTSP